MLSAAGTWGDAELGAPVPRRRGAAREGGDEVGTLAELCSPPKPPLIIGFPTVTRHQLSTRGRSSGEAPGGALQAAAGTTGCTPPPRSTAPRHHHPQHPQHGALSTAQISSPAAGRSVSGGASPARPVVVARPQHQGLVPGLTRPGTPKKPGTPCPPPGLAGGCAVAWSSSGPRWHMERCQKQPGVTLPPPSTAPQCVFNIFLLFLSKKTYNCRCVR